MNESLIYTYGYCIIPKGTILFRGHKNRYSDVMFFGTKHYVAMAFDNNIQIWETTKEIQILFLVEYLTEGSWAISEIPRLYNSLFPEETVLDLNDLNIKKDRIKMNKFANKLFEDFKISGFLTSMEGKEDIEVCLFNKDVNSKQLTLIDISNVNNTSYFKDSLEKIKIFPPESFYKLTKEEINRTNTLFPDEEKTYEQYQQKQNSWIREDVKNGKKFEKLTHEYYNLRTHLKI